MPYRPAESHKLRLIGHSDLNGHGDAMQLMLKDQYLYVGHVLGNMGTTIVDVADPSNGLIYISDRAGAGVDILEMTV